MESKYSMISNQLSQKLNIYMQEDSYKQFLKDVANFEVYHIVKGKEIANASELMNRLIENYVLLYMDSIEKSSEVILKTLKNTIADDDYDLEQLAKEIAFKKEMISESKGKHTCKLSFRLQTDILPEAATALCAAPADVDISAFFRNMILSYLTLPIYKREQIIYKKELDTINKAIKQKSTIHYYNVHSKHEVDFVPYSIEQHSHEMYNYVVGQFDNKYHDTGVIRLSRMRKIFIINKPAYFKPSFSKNYEAMEQNGFQFAIKDNILHQVNMTENDMKLFNGRYLDRPKIYRSYPLEDGTSRVFFNCSKVQLSSYFHPFMDNNPMILDKYFADEDILYNVLTDDSLQQISFRFDDANYRIHFSDKTISFYKNDSLLFKTEELSSLLEFETEQFTVEEMLLSLCENDITISKL